MNSKKPSILKIWANLDLIIAGIAVTILIAVTFVGIIMRYIFGSPFAWLEEITSFCFLWSVLLGACAAFRTGSHVSIEIIVDRLPKVSQRIMKVVIAVITGALLIYLTYQGVIYVGTVSAAKRMTGLVRIPYSLIYGIMPVTSFLMLINMIYAFVKDVQLWGKPVGSGGDRA